MRKKITLRPLDKFFFGGEDFFNDNDKVFYFQKSRDFPQQTSLLGLIRHQLLIQNGLLNGHSIADKDAAGKLIGEHSFEADGKHEFGVIKSISPAFIVLQGKGLTPHWRANTEDGENDNDDFDFGSPIRASFHEQHIQNIKPVVNYTEKEGLEYGFLTQDEVFLAYNEVYVEEEPQIGINKRDRYRGAQMTDDEGFYKYQYCRLRKGYAFTFDIELDDNYEGNPVKLESGFITMGKEQSAFQMTVEDSPQQQIQPDINAGSRVKLLSDTYISNKIYDYCDAIISETISFRNIQRNLKQTNNYAAMNRGSDLSGRLNLLKRGSILHIRQDASIDDIVEVNKLFDKENFKTIGYNHYTLQK